MLTHKNLRCWFHFMILSVVCQLFFEFVITLKSVAKNSPTHHRLCWRTSAAPVLAFDQAHWRRSKLSTAGRGISESGPSEHAACGENDDCAASLNPQLTPGLRLSHSSRIQPHKALHLCRISPPVSRWRILR